MRRLYLFAVTAAGILAAVGAAATVLFIFLNDALSGGLGTATLADTRWAIAIALTSAVVAVIHRRQAGPDIGIAMAGLRTGRTQRVLFVGPPGAIEGRAMLEMELGRAVEWRENRSAPDSLSSVSDPDAYARAARLVIEAPGREVLVIVGPGGLEVVSYD